MKISKISKNSAFVPCWGHDLLTTLTTTMEFLSRGGATGHGTWNPFGLASGWFPPFPFPGPGLLEMGNDPLRRLTLAAYIAITVVGEICVAYKRINLVQSLIYKYSRSNETAVWPVYEVKWVLFKMIFCHLKMLAHPWPPHCSIPRVRAFRWGTL